MKTRKQKALAQQHISPAESAISAAVVVVFSLRFNQQQARQVFCTGILEVGGL